MVAPFGNNDLNSWVYGLWMGWWWKIAAMGAGTLLGEGDPRLEMTKYKNSGPIESRTAGHFSLEPKKDQASPNEALKSLTIWSDFSPSEYLSSVSKLAF